MDLRGLSTATMIIIILIGVASLAVMVYPKAYPPEISVFADPFGGDYIYIRLDGKLYLNDTFDIKLSENATYVIVYNATYGMSKQSIVYRSGNYVLYKLAEIDGAQPISLKTSKNSLIIKCKYFNVRIKVRVWDVFDREAYWKGYIVRAEWSIKLGDEDVTFDIIIGKKIPEGYYKVVADAYVYVNDELANDEIYLNKDCRIRIGTNTSVIADFKVYVQKKSLIWAVVGGVIIILMLAYILGIHRRILNFLSGLGG